MTYKVPKDYNYMTGERLERDHEDRIVGITPGMLNYFLFGVRPSAEDIAAFKREKEKRKTCPTK